MASTRSALMSRIQGKNTEPERILRKALWARGLRYRLHAKTPVGRPDIVFRTAKAAIFVDGCFWHGCPDHYVRPRSQTSFWADKLRENVYRDRRQTLELEALGWTVVRVWEHEAYDGLEEAVVSIVSILRNPSGLVSATRPRVVSVIPASSDGNTERRFHEDLRDPQATYEITQQRITRKWKRR